MVVFGSGALTFAVAGAFVGAGTSADAAGAPAVLAAGPTGFISRCSAGSPCPGVSSRSIFVPINPCAAVSNRAAASPPPSEAGETSRTLSFSGSARCLDTERGPISSMRSRMPAWISAAPRPRSRSSTNVSMILSPPAPYSLYWRATLSSLSAPARFWYIARAWSTGVLAVLVIVALVSPAVRSTSASVASEEAATTSGRARFPNVIAGAAVVAVDGVPVDAAFVLLFDRGFGFAAPGLAGGAPRRSLDALGSRRAEQGIGQWTFFRLAEPADDLLVAAPAREAGEHLDLEPVPQPPGVGSDHPGVRRDRRTSR